MASVRRTALRSAVSRASGGRSEWRRRIRRRTVRGRRHAPRTTHSPASATTTSAAADDDRALDQLRHDVVDDTARGRLAAPPARPGVSRAESPLDQLLQHRLHLAHLAALRLAR